MKCLLIYVKDIRISIKSIVPEERFLDFEMKGVINSTCIAYIARFPTRRVKCEMKSHKLGDWGKNLCKKHGIVEIERIWKHYKNEMFRKS